MVTATGDGIQYSRRRNNRDWEKSLPEASASRTADFPSNSPAWWMALVVFAVFASGHGIWLGLAASVGQLALMTVLQWGVILLQRRHAGGRPWRTAPLLRAARWASFAVAISVALAR